MLLADSVVEPWARRASHASLSQRAPLKKPAEAGQPLDEEG